MFPRDLEGSDLLHSGESKISVGPQTVSLRGKLAQGPDHKLCLSAQFPEMAADFLRIKDRTACLGDVKTFENFILPIPADVDPSRFDAVVVRRESFSQFITAARCRYRTRSWRFNGETVGNRPAIYRRRRQ